MDTLTSHALNAEQRAKLAEMLEEQRRFRFEQVRQLDAPPPWERCGTDAARQIRARIALAATVVLAEMDAARNRLADGTYGWCTRCTASIPFERLEAMPHIAWCEECHREAAA